MANDVETWPTFQGLFKNPDGLPIVGIETLTAGVNINIDNTNPQNPVVSAPNIIQWTVLTKIADYVAHSDECILVNANAGNVNITLPAVVTGRTVRVKKVDASVNTVTITPASGTIDGAATVVIGTQWESHEVVSDGANWFQF